MDKKNIYCGFGTEIGRIGMKIILKLNKIPKEAIKKDNNGDDVVHLFAGKRDGSQSKATHYVKIDDYSLKDKEKQP